METRLLVKNGVVFTKEGFQPVSILIKGGRIDALVEYGKESMISGKLEVIDAGGCLVTPGFIDAHVHFNDPGRTSWEGIETGSLAAAVGGTTTIFDMPLNSSPSVTNLDSLIQKKEYLVLKSYVDYALWGGLTGASWMNTDELSKMKDDIIAWKAFMCNSGIEDFPLVPPKELEKAMKLAAVQGKVLALHAEWEEEVSRLTTYYKQCDGMDERSAFLASRPVLAEEKAVSYVLELAAKYGTAIHFVHISSAKVVELIQQAKASGVDVTVETCPHYLIFDEDDFLSEGALLKCAPPIRPREEVEGLWECIRKGWIDTIGSDHSPCLYSMKATDSIWDAWGGIQGVQFTWLALLDQSLKRRIPLTRVLPLGTSNVAKRFGVNNQKGSIQPGMEADLVLIRLDETTLADKQSFRFRNSFSPYENMTFQLKIKKTILRGNVIYDDSIGIAKEKYGRHIGEG